MKKVLIVGAGACGLAISRALNTHDLSAEVVVVESHDEVKDVQNNPFEQEPILYKAPPRIEDTYVPTKREVENYHPFAKFIGKNNGKKGRGRW